MQKTLFFALLVLATTSFKYPGNQDLGKGCNETLIGTWKLSATNGEKFPPPGNDGKWGGVASMRMTFASSGKVVFVTTLTDGTKDSDSADYSISGNCKNLILGETRFSITSISSSRLVIVNKGDAEDWEEEDDDTDDEEEEDEDQEEDDDLGEVMVFIKQ